jgi:hypothetical protein
MWIRWIRIQIRIRNTGFSFSEEFHSIRTKTKMTFSAMQASRGFLVSGQAQHGFSFLPSGPAPERERQCFRSGSRPPKKMKKVNFGSVLCWAGLRRLHLEPECPFLCEIKKTYLMVMYHKNLSHPDPDSAKCLDPDPASVNPGPKRWKENSC